MHSTPVRRMLARRRHLLALAALIIIFLATAIWNLGDIRMPASDFSPQSDPEEVYLDLGDTVHVDRVYFLIQDYSRVDVDIYWGTADNWTFSRNSQYHDICRKWEYADLGQDTRYIRLAFKGNSGLIGEVAVFSGENKLAISGISTTGNVTTANALIDEQHLVNNPGASRSTTYFDEIYYVRAAEAYLNYNEITDWKGQTSWDHPPLSKLIIAASIGIFGHNPFAWRIAGVLFAALAIVLIFLLARRMFGTPRAGLIAAFLLTFDCMHFAQARIATPDTFIILFYIGMVYFFYRYLQDTAHGGKFLFWSLLFFGLGFSTKWFVMYGFVGLMLLLVIQKVRERKIGKGEIAWFVAGLGASVAVYMFSYIIYFVAPLDHGNPENGWWKIQWDSFMFHSTLSSPHPSGSPWYTWPLMLNPVWFYVGYFPNTRAYIASFGNAALWWMTIPAMTSTMLIVINWFANSLKGRAENSVAGSDYLLSQVIGKKHTVMVIIRWLASILLRTINITSRALSHLWRELGDKREVALFILIPFLAQWLFFIPISRVVFLYHFYPSLIFVILAITLWAEWLWKRFRWGKWVVETYLVLNVACFIFCFPAISGLPMSNAYWDMMQWMVHWIW